MKIGSIGAVYLGKLVNDIIKIAEDTDNPDAFLKKVYSELHTYRADEYLREIKDDIRNNSQELQVL